MNVVVLRGRLSRPAEERMLRSGQRLVSFDITVRAPGEPAASIPVAWFDAPSRWAPRYAGDEVVVFGKVRRRFFQANGTTQSRTEVVADRVLSTRHTKRIEALLDEAHLALGGDPDQ